jgi:uncharacterized protein YciI
MKNIDKVKEQNQTKVIGAPFFPYDGCTILFETEADKDYIEDFVTNDPYVKNNLVSKYEVKEFELESRRKFDRLSGDFVFRS